MSRHGFMELAALHRLDGIHDLHPAEAKRGGGTKSSAGNGTLFNGSKSGLERIKIVCGLPLIGHEKYIHHNGVSNNIIFNPLLDQTQNTGRSALC
jgi:hypothetical protein